MSTEIRLMFLYTRIPNDFLTDGGRYTVLAVQARAALTDRVGLIATKDGCVFWHPNKMLPHDSGWANVAFGVKGALWKDDAAAFIVTGGMRYETR